MAAKNKNGRQKYLTNISRLIVDLESRVICQNVRFSDMNQIS